jgi:Fe-S-cluster containining protein
MHKAHQIRLVKRKAYLGADGARRKKFCGEYQRTVTQIWGKTRNAFFAELAPEGETISCKKGCTYCCFQHVSVTLAHGIVVVDYLYSNDDVMRQFLNNYEQWQKSAGGISKEIDVLFKSVTDASQLISSAKASIAPLSDRYFNLQITCPFLVNSACAIYNIRPMCCAAHYSVSPREWCSQTDPHRPRVYEVMPAPDDLYRLATLADPQFSIHQVTLPILIYRLLTEGLPTVVNDF